MKNKKGISGLISFAMGVFLFGYFILDGSSFEELKKGMDNISKDIDNVKEELLVESLVIARRLKKITYDGVIDELLKVPSIQKFKLNARKVKGILRECFAGLA